MAEISPELNRLARGAGEQSVHRSDEPYRRVLIRMTERLQATAAKLGRSPRIADAPPYDSPDHLLRELETVRDSLAAHGGRKLVGRRLQSLIQLVRVCGFHLLAVDLRQNADVHERTIAELLSAVSPETDYLAMDEAARVKLLLGELADQRPLRSPFADYSDETLKRTRGGGRGRRRCWTAYGDRAMGRYVVSKSAAVSDILEPYVLMKQAGLTRGGRAGSHADASLAAVRDDRGPAQRPRGDARVAGPAPGGGAARRARGAGGDARLFGLQQGRRLPGLAPRRGAGGGGPDRRWDCESGRAAAVLPRPGRLGGAGAAAPRPRPCSPSRPAPFRVASASPSRAR